MKKYIIAIGMALWLLTYNSILAFSSPVESNDIPNWPTGPELNAKSAVLIEANTGVILYAKNIHEHMYPASTTKMLTALLAVENSELNEEVSFSYDAVFSLEEGSSNIGIDPGQAMPMEECLYGIMVASANEVANAIAEHVAGSRDEFANMMNQRVKELGLVDTHFTNPSGLQDENHYTSAYDLAIIARDFFDNDILCKIGNCYNHHFKATAKQPDDFYVRNKHKLINGDIAYEGILGGKTGYTSVSNECLVTCSEQNGMKLICVIMNEDSPEQFYDTVKLFDYGFSNFSAINVAENETKYSVRSTNLFPSSVDILGDSSPILSINDSDYIIMPKNVTFNELEREPDYNTNNDSEIAYIQYSYHGVKLGNGTVTLSKDTYETSAFDENLVIQREEKIVEREKPIFINVAKIIFITIAVSILLSIIFFLLSVFTHRQELRTKRRYH